MHVRVEHAGKRRREEHGRRYRPGTDKLDVADVVDSRDERSDAQPEREQIDDRLDDRARRRTHPIAFEERDLAVPDALKGCPFVSPSWSDG